MPREDVREKERESRRTAPSESVEEEAPGGDLRENRKRGPKREPVTSYDEIWYQGRPLDS